MTWKKPNVGDVVLVAVDKRSNNGATEAPALVTRVWGDTPESLINVRVLLDGSDTLWLTSIKLVDKRPDEPEPDSEGNPVPLTRVAYRS